jgi:hypothetical protein
MVNEAALVAAKQHALHIDTAGLEFAQVTFSGFRICMSLALRCRQRSTARSAACRKLAKHPAHSSYPSTCTAAAAVPAAAAEQSQAGRPSNHCTSAVQPLGSIAPRS